MHASIIMQNKINGPVSNSNLLKNHLTVRKRFKNCLVVDRTFIILWFAVQNKSCILAIFWLIAPRKIEILLLL